jgi:hypothetical protein
LNHCSAELTTKMLLVERQKKITKSISATKLSGWPQFAKGQPSLLQISRCKMAIRTK